MRAQAHDGVHSNLSLKIAGTLPGTPQMLRRVNRMQVLTAIRQRGPVGRADLAALTGLSKVTVNVVVSDLIEAGLVSEELESPDARARRPGPRARLLTFRHDSKHVLGIDVGAAKALVLVSDLAGHRVGETRLSTEAATSRGQVIDLLRSGIESTLATASLTVNDIVAVGVGTPGVVDPADGAVDLAPQLPDWEGFDLAEELGMFENAPVMVANEVHLALIGEVWRGAAQGVNHVSYVHIGVGVGLGILIDGELHRGASGAAGEIGYLPCTDDDPNRPEGTGTFEWEVGGPAYARHAAEVIAAGGGHGMVELAEGGPVDAAVVFQAAERGDVEAREIVHRITDVTARGVAGMLIILDPDLLIIGGGVSKAGAGLLDPLAEKVAAMVPRAPKFAISELGDEAVAIGALRFAIDRWESDMFTLKN